MHVIKYTWAALLLALFIAACSMRPEIRNIEDGIAVTSADITSVANQIRAICGNQEPDGPCLSTSLLDTETKQDWKERLRDASEQIVLANAAVNARDQFEASDKLRQAEVILRLVREELARREGSDQ